MHTLRLNCIYSLSTSPYMTNYKLAFRLALLAFLVAMSGIAGADTATAPKPRKSPEAAYSEGLACLGKSDIPCAQVSLAGIPSQSAYAKLLAGNIAAAAKDYDSAFRLLLPLQADKTLSNEASASLHASLALAYDDQQDAPRALEQRVIAETYLQSPEEIRANQARIWNSLRPLSRADLVEMRGNSQDTTIQGWIDLALAAGKKDKDALTDWRSAYPDHPAIFISQDLTDKQAVNKPVTSPNDVNGQIALILPFSSETYYPAADAIERGFMAAQYAEKGAGEVKIYASHGDRNEIVSLYTQALSEGAHYVVGPLTRDEVSTLAADRIQVPTLTLNYPETQAADGASLPRKAIPNLYSYGLSADAEAAQVVKYARDLGMQTATVVMSDDVLASRIAKSFSDAWIADGGQIRLTLSIADANSLNAIKSEIAGNPADMIFLSANAESARTIRPYLDIATPTFAISHIYSGIWENPDDQPLAAIRFADMPWLLESSNPEFAGYELAAVDLPPGEMQRWFALGADAYKLLVLLSTKHRLPTSIDGLSGKIRVNASGEISRELSIGRFGKNGVLLEKSPK